MTAIWHVPVGRLSRYQLPLVSVRLYPGYEVEMVLASGEAITSIAAPVARDLQEWWSIPGGRRVVPSDAGPVIARTLRLSQVAIRATERRWLELGTLSLAITFRPQALGVGGLLGIDVLGRFKRITYESGPPATLILEEP